MCAIKVAILFLILASGTTIFELEHDDALIAISSSL